MRHSREIEEDGGGKSAEGRNGDKWDGNGSGSDSNVLFRHIPAQGGGARTGNEEKIWKNSILG